MNSEAQHIDPVKILIIDADKRSRSLLARSIQKKWNAEIAFADNALLAIENIPGKNFEFIFIDSIHSVLSAAQSLDEILQKARFQTSGFILVQKDLDVQKTVEALRSGFKGFITKPFHFDVIDQKLRMQHQENVRQFSMKEELFTNKILLADGSERYRSHLRDLLKESFDVSEAVTGFDALVQDAIEVPDKIVLSSTVDVVPFESVIRQIRSTRAGESKEIFVTLFDTSPEMKNRIVSLGATSIFKRTLDTKNSLDALRTVGILPAEHDAAA